MRKIFSVLGVFILIIAALMAIDAFFGRRAILAMKIGDIELGKYADGIYEGIYEYYRWSNEVSVSLVNHKITDIDVSDAENLPKGLVDKITNEVIKKQSLDVDAVSGATVTSKTILKAIENAFK